MEKEELKEFLEKQKHPPKEAEVNWELHKSNWIEHVNRLYNDIDNWLKDFITNRMLEIKKERIEIVEEEIGKYSIDKYIIIFPDYQIALEPLGTMIIGAWGRIEMIGYLNKSLPLLLLPPHVSRTSQMVQVEIIDTGDNGAITGNISIGSKPSEPTADSYPDLEWKLFDENTRVLNKLTNTLFYDCIKVLSKDANK